MIRRGIIFGFFLLSSPVRAYVDEPKGCWHSERQPCAVRATAAGEKFKFQQGSRQGTWASAKGTSWIIEDQDLKLLTGKIWIQTSAKFNVVTNQVKFEADGEFWIENASSKTKVINLSGNALHLALVSSVNQSQETQTLPVGFENWFGSLDSSGQASRGILRPVAKAEFFKVWAQKMKVSEVVAKKKMADWKELWQDSAVVSADLYTEVVHRAIAQNEQKKNEIARRKENVIEEQQRLRKMFRARNGLQD